MRTFIQTTQDATIYERYPSANTGLDEIIEVGKVVRPTDTPKLYASASARMLLTFDIPSQQQYSSSSMYYLNLRLANATNVNRYQKLEIYPVSSNWVEGSGYFYQETRNAQDGTNWYMASSMVSWSMAGGDFVTSPSASYTFTKIPIEDIKIDVTNIISPVVSGSNQTVWNGLLIKFPDADEINQTNTGNIKFFSGNTHTVFAPKLEIVSVDQTMTTGSLKALKSSYISIVPKNLKEAYTIGEIDKVRLVVRDPFPDKKFDSIQRYKSTYYLPSESYYRIKDQVSGVVLYDFDQYSAISCDLSGSYFTLDTSGLDVNRYYTIDLKIKSDGLVFFPEFNYTFKIDTNA